MTPRSRLFMLALLPVGTLALTAGSPRGVAAPVISHPLIAHEQATALGWASSNWSGYAITGGSGAYHSVTGHWTVTAVQSSSSARYSAGWIGIDGFNNSQLIQTGTEADYYNGSAHYSAWWEILPAPETAIGSITVSPGDHMSASVVKQSTTSWKITITDTTTGASFSTTKTYTGPGASAEWVEEAPEVNGSLAKLANYGKIKFDPGKVNGANPHLTASDGGVMIQNGTQVSTPSNPDSDTDGFNVKYGSTQPSPPST